MPGQTFFIGDVHGCARELALLLDLLSRGPEDRLIFIGDLVNKGPDPAGVLRLVRSAGAECLRGNHENAHLAWQAGGVSPKEECRRTRALMSDSAYTDFLNFAARMPLYLESDSFVAVHAAIERGLPLPAQKPGILTGDITLAPSWKDGIDLGRPLVVGHKRHAADPSEPFVVEGKFYGIDTACVYGGRLSSLTLPAGTIHSVAAARDYSADAE